MATGIWTLLVAMYAYSYVVSRVASPDAVPGYESAWDFQLWMFVFFRLPVALLVFAFVWVLAGKVYKDSA